MRVVDIEKAYLGVAVVLLVACLGALLYATTGRHMHLPGSAGEVDPATVATTPPFDHPGVRQTAPGHYEVVIVARTWYFTPNEIRIPAGSEVTFIATSGDVIHGLDVAGTRVNAMIIPGQVTRVVHTFTVPGEYLLVCHEYCGVGHHTMSGKVIVQ